MPSTTAGNRQKSGSTTKSLQVLPVSECRARVCEESAGGLHLREVVPRLPAGELIAVSATGGLVGEWPIGARDQWMTEPLWECWTLPTSRSTATSTPVCWRESRGMDWSPGTSQSGEPVYLSWLACRSRRSRRGGAGGAGRRRSKRRRGARGGGGVGVGGAGEGGRGGTEEGVGGGVARTGERGGRGDRTGEE